MSELNYRLIKLRTEASFRLPLHSWSTHSGFLNTDTHMRTHIHRSDFNGKVQANFTSFKRAVSNLPRLCFIKTGLCSKIATPRVMTKERSQHKGSCHGNLYGQQCHTDWKKKKKKKGVLGLLPADSETSLLCNLSKKLLSV